MKYANYILLLRVPLAQASGRPRWNRRTMQYTFVAVGCVCLFALVNYSWYLSGEGVDMDLDGSLETMLDTVYLPFQPSPQSQEASSTALRPTLPLPASCLDAHLARGERCSAPNPPPLDILWTWVNGSDILLQDAKARIEDSFPVNDPYRPSRSWKTLRQFRDHDELRHSMRSALAHFRPHAGNFHLLTSDFEIPVHNDTADNEVDWRLGQVPQWLNVKLPRAKWTDGKVQLYITHHADFFQPYHDTVFNSYAIESQFGHLQDLSENFVYMNDDFFFYNPVGPQTFYSSPYGLVLRLQSDLLVAPTQYANNVKGEWRNLAASNTLLSDRFGVRSRPYVSHLAKSGSMAMLHEMVHIWSAQAASATLHPFRETLKGDSDLSTLFMLAHFVVERWREALLWSWTVAKHGGLDDEWGPEEADAAWEELGGDISSREDIRVRTSYRDSLLPERVKETLRASGYKNDDPTTYLFTSQDGYPYASFLENFQNKWPSFDKKIPERLLPRCTINWSECFADQDVPLDRASEVFKHVAFRKPKCGDCITLSLLRSSGSSGLSAFLPSHDRLLSSESDATIEQDEEPTVPEVPHLSLEPRWEDGAFALRDVMASYSGESVRTWTLELLQRYRFVIGETPSHFAMLTGPSDATSMVRNLQRNPNIALLCINDDIAIGQDQVSDQLKKWESEQWRVPAAWEIR